MATVFLGQDYLVKNSSLDSNVEFKKVVPFIISAQRKYLKRLLGSKLYDTMEVHVLAKINTNTPIPVNYSTLLTKYIIDLLVNYTMLEYSLTAKYRVTNKGVVVKRSDNSEAADDTGMELIMNVWKSNAEMIADEMIEYIRFNPSFFPEYFQNVNEDIKPEQESYDTDMYLGEDNRIYRDKGYRLNEYWDKK